MRLEELARVASEIRFSLGGGNQVVAGKHRDGLVPLVAAMQPELPHTRRLAERQFTSREYAEDALTELQDAARELSSLALAR